MVANILDGGFNMRSSSMDQTNGVIGDDGSFTITGIYGRILFQTEVPGWQLRSVMLDGVDITDLPYDASRGGTDKLEIVVTDVRQQLIGTVVDTLGKPPERFSVLIFPSSPREGSVTSRFIALNEVVKSNGMFQISHLPVGDYFAAALDAVPENAQFDPGIQEAIKPRATPFHLSPGQTTKLELSLIE